MAASGVAGEIKATGNVQTTTGFFTDVNGTLHPLVNGATQTGSGTATTFTGIPSWAKRVTLMLNSVQMTGGSNKQFRLGTSGGIATTGYLGFTGGSAGSQYSSGFTYPSFAGGDVNQGHVVFCLLDPASNIWTVSGSIANSNNGNSWFFSGSIALPSLLTQVQFTSTNGTETFVGGNFNILYE